MTEATVSTPVPAARQAAGEPIYTAEDMLTAVLAAYERGRSDATVDRTRCHWNAPSTAQPLRAERIAVETAHMKRHADSRYLSRGYPEGYAYRGGPVDWDTGMPAGSGCAWLRRKRLAPERQVAA